MKGISRKTAEHWNASSIKHHQGAEVKNWRNRTRVKCKRSHTFRLNKAVMGSGEIEHDIPSRLCTIRKTDCQPPCHNRGSCSRPHTCVCRSGFQGARCEEAAPEQVYIHNGGSLRRIQPGTNPFQREQPRRRPTERRGPADSSSPQQTGTSRTVKRYPSSTGPITSNALPNGNGHDIGNANGHSSNGHRPTTNGANLTSSLDRIKIVFTPMVCRRVCSGGRCYNSCEKGDTTTVYSENQQQHQPAKTQGFRLFFCQIPCLNGGRCIGRDQCWCPTNSTGKFCHLPAPPPARPTLSRKDGSLAGHNSSSHSMYTLPLSNQQASLHPSMVNVHIQHPHEAEVQIHQVARVKPGQRPPAAEGAHSVQQRSQPGNGIGNGHGHTRPHNRQNGYVGRCFQETVDGQCGKPLPGLTKQDDCCGSVGASWGLNKCTECPTKPAYAVIANGQVECPKGYKRMNMTHCQDINECLMNGICKNAECLNTRGSYRCTCKPGYMLDPARSHCVSDKAVSDQRGMCYRSASAGICSLPLAQHITKQICCCSRVGKAWGTACERCPLPDTDHFKEICPAGHGYTYSRSDVQISLRQLEEEELRRTGVSWEAQNPSHHQLPQQPAQPPQQLPHVPQIPQYPYHRQPHQPQHTQHPHQPQHPQHPQEIPHHPQTPHQCQYLLTDIDKCSITPTICGHGLCVPVQTGYTCYCDPGYKLSALQTNCIDVNECEGDPCGGKGRCVNTFGSYTCQCYSGYSQVITQNRKFCQDINECDMANKCQDGDCVNTEGSYTCECKSGYAKSWKGPCEDVDECQGPSPCPSGRCVNTPGSFQCQACGPGFRAASGRCLDIDECELPTTCPKGTCTNTEGSFTCTTCGSGYRVTEDGLECDDVDECLVANVCPGQLCRNSPGSFSCSSCGTGFTLSEDGSHCQDINECLSPGVCPMGVCSNTEGSYSCMTCDLGFTLAPNGLTCEDINECEDRGLCLAGQCTNNPGSYSCSCPSGLEMVDGTSCRDVDECQSGGICGDGDCLNTEGSYLCICPDGYTTGTTGTSDGIDVDECSKDGVCSHGQCLNTGGSYICLCETGFKYSVDTADCEDQNECKEFGSSVCGTWRCENTIGSYRCFMGCQPGLYGQDNPDCDIDECVNETICGDHGFCENTDGSYRCQCDQGYSNPPDVNECEMSTALCGEALCENVDGSFLCICPSDNEEFDPITSQCRPQGEDAPPKPASPTEEQRKECYYNLNDANFCDNVLSRNTTKQECCCTVGAGWGDDCEIHPCPVPGREEYDQLCPHGSGLLPQAVFSHSLEQQSFKDVDECKMFGPDICKNGRCSNNFSSYSCFCRTGFYYDNIRLECVDYDECLTEKECVDGVCVNTAGSFDCFCSPPLVLDTTRRRCVSTHEPEEDIHLDICWQGLVDERMCAQPLIGRRTTYTECCCLYGVAWSEQCAFCPMRDSDDYAAVCNLPRRGGSDSLRERPGYEYGPGVEGPDGPYVPPYWDNYGGGPITGPGDIEPPLRVPVHRPREFQPRPVDSYNDRFDGFEGLRAEECGILNGCENGRCVRVREGYTCDCFDGYELDLTKMACIDINECEDISDNVALCKNGACTNTEGSYKCICLPGFQASANTKRARERERDN
uniref:Latent-transforming growth factor beta-binding protein 2 n=1 Tax=Oncorhynchus tshawytscha TaxID=74940 RepID=A0A8C8DCN9_ONCTS